MSTYFKYLKSYYSYTFLLKVAFFISVIISVIDYLNLPTEYLKNLDSRVIILLSISLVFILFLISIELHLFDIFKLESINIIDMLLMLIIFSSLLYSIAATVLSIFHVYKIVSISLLLVFTIPILFERIKSFKNTFILQTEYKSNVLDLKQIYDNNFEITDDIPILIEEKDVDYDLLNRSRTINLLYTSILNCNPTTSFVISLEGKWGSGKTTIINNTKNLLNKPEHENIVIIDDLDPWSYETPESLFNSMFERILNQSNINFNAFETTQMINTAYMEIFTDKKINALKNFIFPTGNLKNVKDKINDQLKFSNKKVVFFIDNIDRTENENIILLFKLVANILDFERVVYVLSFDNERVESILKHDLKLDYAYLKKIIQMQIRVPQTDNKSYLEIFEKSISNILMKFGESPQSIYTTHSDLINFMATNTTDLRDFKRFINSALSFSYKTISYLNKRDLLTMEYIRLNNINLYEIIYKNPNYFVSHDRDQNKFGEITPFFDKPGFEIEIKSFYDELFGSPENNPYQNLLKNLFPYVDNYVKNQKYRSNSSIVASDISFESIAKGRNICSQKFFPLYFDYTSNEYIYISETLDLFIANINSNQNSIEEIYSSLLDDSLKSYQHKEFMERLQFYLTDIEVRIIPTLIEVLFKNLTRVNSYSNFGGLSVRTRVIIIIWYLLQMITDEEYELFVDYIKTDYKKITNIKELLYWFKNDRENKNIPGRYEKLEVAYEICINSVVEKEINIYLDEYYQPGNILAVYTLNEQNLDILKKYVDKTVNEKNIFRFLNDLLSTSAGSRGVSYYIRKERFIKFTTKENVDSILSKTRPSNLDEEIVLEIYNNHIVENKEHSFTDDGLRFSDYLELNL